MVETELFFVGGLLWKGFIWQQSLNEYHRYNGDEVFEIETATILVSKNTNN